MLGTVPFAHQPRAGDRVAGFGNHGFSARLAVQLVGERVEELGRLARDTAVGQFLDSIRQAQLKEAATVVRCVGTEQGLPFRLQIVDGIRFSATTRASTVASRSLCSPGRGGVASLAVRIISLQLGSVVRDHNCSSEARSRANCLRRLRIKSWTVAREHA